MFQRYSRPVEPVTLDAVVTGLAELRAVTLQSLFAGGPGCNAAAEHVAAWIEKVVEIRPIDVQVYTLDRAWPAADLEPLDAPALAAIAETLHRAGCPATVHGREGCPARA